MKPILFICASDTLVRLLLPVAKKLTNLSFKVEFTKLQFNDEAAEFELGSAIDRSSYVGSVHHNKKWLSQYQAIVMGNDWGYEIRSLILLARQIGIPTICVQESVINFNDKYNRMLYSDYAFVQGEMSARILSGRRENIVVTGNPRYENLRVETRLDYSHVLVNCNFTYGIEESHRDSWLRSVITSCDSLGKSVTILQHPRDRADLTVFNRPVIRTNASIIHSHLKGGSVLITRFSSLIHEAILTGLPVIYFNPFQEIGGYDFGKECPVLKYANNDKDLEAALMNVEKAPPQLIDYENYLQEHINYSNKTPSGSCAEAIQAVLENKKVFFSRYQDPVYRNLLLIRQIARLLYRILIGEL